MEKHIIKIAYVAGYDATDLSCWSGLGCNIWRALEKQGCEIHHFQPAGLPGYANRFLNLGNRVLRRVFGRRYLVRHSVLLAKHQARQVDDWVAQRPDLDAIVSPGTIPVAFMRQHKPLITWSDATHTILFNSYPEFSEISKISHWEGDCIEKSSLRRASAAIFSSDWAARSAICDYGASKEKVHVVPFGANLENVPEASEVHLLFNLKFSSAPQILFLGVDWKRKGGDIAVNAVRFLRERGLDATLRVIGCVTPDQVRSLPWVLSDGFIDKRTEDGKRHLEAAFRSATLLMVPSLAECYGLVYCEANAYGVPAVGCDVGGVSTIIRDGENGLLMKGKEFTEEDGQRILALLQNPFAYEAMVKASRTAYDERLNWEVAGRDASKIIFDAVSKNALA